MESQPPTAVDPDDFTGALDPRFATPARQIFDMNARLEAVKLYGTEVVLGPRPTFYNSDDYPEQADGPASDDDHRYEVDPWGRPRETLLRPEDPFIDRDVNQGEADDRRGTDIFEMPQFGNFGPYFRKLTTNNDLVGKHIAPKHTSGRYDITTFIDEIGRAHV